MEPLIQYAVTRDGVSIAFWATGNGPPLLHLPTLPLSNLQVEWGLEYYRSWFDRLAERHTLIHYDSRGTGLSERKVEAVSLDDHLLDIEAVLRKAGVEHTDIFASSYAGPIGIRYTARHPDTVGRLILWCTHARHADVAARLDLATNRQREAVNRLAEVDWDLFIRTYLHRAIGWAEGPAAEQFAKLARSSIEPANFFTALTDYVAFDASGDLPNVVAPTLVLHRPDFIGSHVDVARRLAAAIPNARLVLLNGSSVVPSIGEHEAVLRVVQAFLAEGAAPSADTPGERHQAAHGPLRTIVYAEAGEAVAGFVAQPARAAGDDARAFREAVRRHGGGDIKLLGDGFAGTFASAQAALDCAIDLQKAAARPDSAHRLRIGVNAGEPISGERDAFAVDVVIAARIGAHALPEQVLVAGVVRELVAGKGFTFGEPSESALGDADEPLRLYELDWHRG